MSNHSSIREAAIGDIETIVSLMFEMQEEIKELSLDRKIVEKSITDSMNENVHWFLFLDEAQNIFGTCYMQSVHNYWRIEKRYYRGGFYIKKEYRKQGHYRHLNNQLETWARAHNGVQIYAHIHKDNKQSLNAANAVGLEEIDYKLCAKHWGSD